MGFDTLNFSLFDDARFARTNRSRNEDEEATQSATFFDGFSFGSTLAPLTSGDLEFSFAAQSAQPSSPPPAEIVRVNAQAEPLPDAKESKLSSSLYTLRSIGDDIAATTDTAQRASLVQTAQNGSSAVLGEFVVVDVIAAAGETDALLEQLNELGLVSGASFANVVSGLLPLTSISSLESIDILIGARETPLLLNVGSVTTQADASARADEARAQFNVDGTGLSIGVLSDSFNNLNGFNTDIATGDLPANITVLQDLPVSEEGSDEGRAILQLIHDIAPGADLLFQTAFLGVANFAQGIINLANAGADIIIDDVIYFSEPFFQDGPIAQAVDQVTAQGVLFFSSAGNSGTDSYEAVFRNSGQTITVGGNFAGVAHDFDPGVGVDTRQLLSLDDEDEISLSFQYDEPFASSGGAGATSDYDIFLFEAGTNNIVASSTTSNANDAVEIFQFTNETGSTQQYELVITRFSGSNNNLLKYIDFSGDGTFLEFTTNSPTLVGHANAAGAIAVGAAAFFNTPEFRTDGQAFVNGFSSRGSVPILFDRFGTRLITPDDRGGPAFTAPDGGNTTFFGTDVGFDSDSFPNFFGTSASAPAAAAIAALLLERVPTATREQIVQVLSDTAIDIGTPGTDLASGAGLIQADAALSALIALTSGGPAGPTPGDDVLDGTADADTIDALAGNDRVSGLGGDDTLLGSAGNDTLLGGEGADSLVGGAGADSLVGGVGANTLVGGSGPDELIGDADNDFLDGGTNNDVITGFAGDDMIFGRSGADTIDGGLGNDFIDAFGGFDSVIGGDGDDTITTGVGADTIFGGVGDDLIDSGTNLDSVFGGEGNDTITDGTGSSTIDGGLGNDSIDGRAGSDVLDGGLGDDTVLGGIGPDTITGGDGDDSLNGNTNNDVIDGGLGNDSIFGESGADTISGGDGDDLINALGGFDSIDGGAGNDTISGAIGADTIFGGDGDDLIDSGTNLDMVFGGDGNDTISDDSGSDTIDGGAGDDLISAGGGFDQVQGGEGNDTVSGEVGNDTLDGGAGNDLLSGGGGSDTFIFAGSFGADQITDFTAGLGISDVIDLSAVSSITDFADLVDNHLSSDPMSGFAIITTAADTMGGGGDTITLLNVLASDLVADDFIF